MEAPPRRVLRAADHLGRLGVGEVGDVAQHDGGPLLLRKRANAVPQLRLLAGAAEPGVLRAAAVHLGHGHRPAPARPVGVDRLAVRDGQQPAAHVGVRPEPGIRAQRGDERILEGVVGLVGPGGRHQEPVHIVAVLIEHPLERRQRHGVRTPWPRRS